MRRRVPIYLPDTIQFVNGNQIVNLYDASGRKYKSIVYTLIPTATAPYSEIVHYTLNDKNVDYLVTDYEGSIEKRSYLHAASTQRIYNSTGYYMDGAYYYYLKDHLGNICAVVNATADTLVQKTLYYASGVPMAQSTGRDAQPYLYNGKEFIEAHGLNEYDSQARWYYSPIMRTTRRYTYYNEIKQQHLIIMSMKKPKLPIAKRNWTQLVL